MEYDVSIILINYNSSRHTIDCVRSIIEKTSKELNFNIIIVDNCSEKSDFMCLNCLSGVNNVNIVRSNINLGFAAGNMYGLTFTRAKYYFFLNNDCKLLNDVCSILYNFCEKNASVGVCSPQLISEHGAPLSSFDYFPVLVTKILGTGILRLIKGKEFRPRKGIYTEPVKVDVVSGSQMFVRSSAFNEIGGFDTIFFLYCEEEDLCLRMHNAGYAVYINPQAKNYHLGGGSTVKSYDIRKEFYISFLYFYMKHYGYIKTSILKLLLFLRIFRKIYKDNQAFKLSLFVLRGAHLKHSLRHRQKIIDIELQ